jgi:benzoyl-CoA reductase/2-hydroxyglutaryl-CoA dehydratase subunit BcrC/BadD/HgdB
MPPESKGLALESWELIKALNNGYIRDILQAKENGKLLSFQTAFFPPELLAAFDVVGVPGEWYGSLCGFDRKIAIDILNTAERRGGFPGEVCSYARTSIGSAICDSSFMGGFPKPDIVFGIEGECNFHLKWFETMARYFNVPFFPLDAVPCDVFDLPNWGESSHKEALEYLLRQIHRYVDFMEHFTKQKMKEEKVIKAVVTYQRNLDLWSDICDLASAFPSPVTIRSLFTFENAVISVPCKPETTKVLVALKAELGERIKKGLPGLPNERIRLLWDCQPPWFDLNLFRYFESKGANFVASPYLADFGSKHWSRISGDGLRHRLYTRTIPTNTEESLWEIARLHTSRHARPRLHAFVKDAVEQAKEAKVDGAVLHYVRGCKTVPYGIYDKKKAILDELGIPTLILESSTADPRDYSETNIRSQVDSFLIPILDRKKREKKLQ